MTAGTTEETAEEDPAMDALALARTPRGAALADGRLPRQSI